MTNEQLTWWYDTAEAVGSWGELIPTYLRAWFNGLKDLRDEDMASLEADYRSILAFGVRSDRITAEDERKLWSDWERMKADRHLWDEEDAAISAQDQGLHAYFAKQNTCPHPPGSQLAAAWLEAYCFTAEHNTDKGNLS